MTQREEFEKWLDEEIYRRLFMTTAPLTKLSKAVQECKHEEACDFGRSTQSAEYLLNPDAVAVKWFKCKLCGRTRKEDIKVDKQKVEVKPIWSS